MYIEHHDDVRNGTHNSPKAGSWRLPGVLEIVLCFWLFLVLFVRFVCTPFLVLQESMRTICSAFMPLVVAFLLLAFVFESAVLFCILTVC